MSALAQETRLRVFQLLVDALPDAISASDVADAVGITRNGMSAHFAILSAAGLVSSKKVGRNVLYRADTGPLADLTAFLTRALDRGRKADGEPLDW